MKSKQLFETVESFLSLIEASEEHFYVMSFYNTAKQVKLQGQFNSVLVGRIRKQGFELALSPNNYLEGQIEYMGLNIEIVLT